MRASAAILLSLFTPALAQAVELESVTVVDERLLNQLLVLNAGEASKILEGQTGRIEVTGMDAGLAERLPYGPNAVVYFAPNGDLLVWSAKSDRVELGYWEILDDGHFNDLCLRFGTFGLDSVCASPEIDNSTWLKELSPGNPFSLAPEQPVPAALAAAPSTLTDIAATLP